jgi:zinc protease
MNNGSSHFIKFIYPHENHKELLVKVYDTLKDLFENGFNEDEIDRIKGQYIASKVYEKEHIESMAFSLGYGFAQYNDLDGDKKFIEKVQNTTLEQVNNAFKNILSKVIHSNQQISHNQKSAAFEKETKDFFKKLAKLVKVKSPKKKSVKHTRSSFDPSVSYINLPNNNKLIYRHNPMTPTFVLQAYIQGGLSAETNKNNGAFNLISSLLPTGYDKINRQQLKKSLEEKSASLHGFSGKNAYGLMMHGQTKDYSELSEMFFSSLLRPSFANKELAHEKEIVKRSIQAFNDEPSRILFQKISKTFFMDHPYARTPLGTLAGQKVLTRKFLKNLHDQQVSSGSIVFTMCGDIPVEKVLATIESLDLPKARAKSIKTMPKKFKPKLVAEHKHTHMDREQTHLFYGIPTEGISNKYHLSLKVLTSFLSGQSSELFTDVRDKKGLCYVAQPIHFNALEAGYWGIYMASTPSKVELAVKSLDGIISKLTKKGMSKSTFNKVKVMMRGQNQINIQTNEDYAGVYSVPVLQGLGLDYFHRGNEQIDALTLEQFNKDLRSLFKQGLALFTVGNHEN